MSIPIIRIRGMSGDWARRLRAQAIHNSEQLLRASARPGERSALARTLGTTEREMLGLANRADLARIKGIAGFYSDLLEQAGVDTVRALAARGPEALHAELLDVNAKDALCKRPPTLRMVEDWVRQAKALPRLLIY